MKLIVATPRTIVTTKERRHVANEPIWRWNGEPADEYPFVVDGRAGRRIASGLGPLEVAGVEREDSTGTKGAADCSESTPDRRFVAEIAENVTHRDDRVCCGNRVVRKNQQTEVFRGPHATACQLQHCR